MTDDTLPPLPSASVDFNALHDDLASGTSPRDAVSKLERDLTDDGSAANQPVEDHKYVTASGGGWFAVKSPEMDEAEKVQGREAANERAAEIEAARTSTIF